MTTKIEKLTITDLKNNKYGTHFGKDGKENALSHEIVINFIEKYFNSLNNIEIWEDEILSTDTEFSLNQLTKEDLEYYLNFFNENNCEENIYFICEVFGFLESEELLNNFNNINNKLLICEIFEELIDFYSGYIKITINDNLIRIESF